MNRTPEFGVAESLADSEAFGIRIGRITLSRANRSNLDYLSFEGFDCVIIDDIDSISSLRILQNHRELRYAGTIVYWVGNSDWLELRRSSELYQGIELVTANESNLRKFVEVCLDAFDGYVSHYAYSPTLDSKPVNSSYADWITRKYSHPNFILVGYEIEGSLASFALCEYKTGSIEVLLAGTAKKHRKSGAYTSLINSLAHKTPSSISEFLISTQAANIEVQKLWSKFGLLPQKTITRYHLWLN